MCERSSVSRSGLQVDELGLPAPSCCHAAVSPWECVEEGGRGRGRGRGRRWRPSVGWLMGLRHVINLLLIQTALSKLPAGGVDVQSALFTVCDTAQQLEGAQ